MQLKSLKRTGVILPFIALTAVLGLLYANQIIASENAKTLEFSEKQSLEEFIGFVDKFNIESGEVLFSQGSFSGGYEIDSTMSPEEQMLDFQKEHEQFLQVMESKKSSRLERVSTSEDITRIENLNKSVDEAISEYEDIGLEVTGFISSNSEDITNLSNIVIGDVQIDSESLWEKVKGNITNLSKKLSLNLLPTASAYGESWAPYGGEADVNQSYADHSFSFGDTSEFAGNSTYEHETQIYDGDFVEYGGYWSSNFARGYKDTQFADDNDLDNFAVGTADASLLVETIEYTTYMSFDPGTTSSATTRIKGQKGYRVPSSCYSTWCISSNATTNSMATFTAPGGMSYVY